jgi:UDP-N-acetylglucosamine acyltransferase
MIHPTAVIEGDVTLADDVFIGPYCVLDGVTGPITIGHGCRLVSCVNLCGPLVIGERNTLYPYTCLGFSPQDLKWDPSRPGAGVVIGDNNTFRESSSVNRATSDERPTVIGNDNYLMANSHVGHDSRVENHCILAQGAMLGGFVHLSDQVNVGGTTGVHQHCRVGRGAMLSGGMGLTQDLPPFFLLTGVNLAGGVNLIGLRRAGTPSSVIDEIRWVYRTLYRTGLSMKSALAALRDHAPSPTIDEYILFIEQSKRGICQGRTRAVRSTLERTAKPMHQSVAESV